MNNNGGGKLTFERVLNNKDEQKQMFQFPSNSPSSENADKVPLQSSTLIHQSPTTSTPTLAYQHPNTAKSVVRLSDNEISEILSLPIALVSDNPYSAAPTDVASGAVTSATSSNVATTTTVSDSSIISPNNENNHLSNMVGFDGKLDESPLAIGHIERNRSSIAVEDIFINNNNNNNNNNAAPDGTGGWENPVSSLTAKDAQGQEKRRPTP